MLNFKIKTPQESHHSTQHTQPHHKPSFPEHKLKKHKEQPQKRKIHNKHQPSKSNIQPHHYNQSTTLPSHQTCTFTNILRHSHHPNAHSTLPHTPHQLEFSHLINQKLQAIQSYPPECSPHQKSNSKSPLRVTNAHRLNNTPKIKDKHTKSGKQIQSGKETTPKESKTFADVLKTTGFTLQEPINLLCSQKIDKFIKEEKQHKDEISTRNKSNLQSTGIINLSHPAQHNESPRKTHKTSHINSLAQVRQFQQLCISQPTFQQMKTTLQQLNQHIQRLLTHFNEQHFLQSIHSQYNPELNHQQISNKINQLNTIKIQFINHFSQITQQLDKISKNIQSNINNTISNLKDSSSSCIDWIPIDYNVQVKQTLETHYNHNEILSIRLQSLQPLMSQSFLNLPQTQIELKYPSQIKQLRKIDQSIHQQLNKLKQIEIEINEKDKKQSRIWQNTVNSLKKQLQQVQLIGINLKTTFSS